MDIIDNIDNARVEYISFYKKAASYYEDKVGKVSIELLIRINGVPEDAINSLSRVDIVYKQDDQLQMVEVNLDKAYKSKNSKYDYFGQTISLHPIVWNGIEIYTDTKTIDEPKLLRWYGKWMDIEDEKPINESGFSSVIHSFNYEISEQGYSFSIDFGTSELESFTELLDIIKKSGAKNITIGSFTFDKGT